MSTNRLAVGLGHSLEKFLPHSPVPRARTLRLSALRGEVVSCQVVYRGPELFDRPGRRNALAFHTIALTLEGPAAPWARARPVGLAHVEHPSYEARSFDRIDGTPGFFPDPLVEEGADLRLFPAQTRAFWVTLRVPTDAPAGPARLDLLASVEGKTVGRFTLTVDVIPLALPPQRLKLLHWFHNDCLMSRYGFDAWSPAHWAMAERYLRNAADHGVNMLTVPAFTPPTDTAIGAERPTVQLVDVFVTGKDRYRFDFARLERWIDLGRRCGMTHFSIAQLATQWGAKCAPKIVARGSGGPEGKTRQIFGWDDASNGPRYAAFLGQFLPRLVECLKRKGVAGNTVLSVSDEPSMKSLPEYGAVRALLRKAAPELPVLDALVDLEFQRQGLVDIPVPATDHAQPFLDAGVKPLWCYYCCAQATDVANRFLDFHSARNRILGWQLHKFGFEGFLHWGFNHWYERISDVLIDPYTNTHAGRPLPPGDGFVVYPGREGPIDSIRWEIFREALQDMRALQLLQDRAGDRPKADVASLLALKPVESLKCFPREDRWIFQTREKVNRALVQQGL